MKLSQKLKSLNLSIPALAGAFGAYVPAKRCGDLLYTAGQIPMKDGKAIAVGAVPSACTVEQAQEGARQCVINALSAAQGTIGDLDQLKGVLRVGAFIHSDSDFTRQPEVANAASELLLELFGDAGKHVRVAVACNSLPLGVAVEIEFIFQL